MHEPRTKTQFASHLAHCQVTVLTELPSSQLVQQFQQNPSENLYSNYYMSRTIFLNVNSAPCHNSMAHPQTANERASTSWRVANISGRHGQQTGVVPPTNPAYYKMLQKALNLNTGKGPEMDNSTHSTEPLGSIYGGDLPDSRVTITCRRRTMH